MREPGRLLYLDILRIMATVAVIIIHISIGQWYMVKMGSMEWTVCSVFYSLCRWSVPMFCMLSGALFLSEDIPLQTVFTKKLPQVLVALGVWSLIYSFLEYIEEGLQFSTAFKNFLKGHHHQWFLFMIIGFYLVVPFLRKIVKDRKCMWYFLFLSFICAIVIPQILSFIDGSWRNVLDEIITKSWLQLPMGYSFYFVLGHYLTQMDLEKKIQHLCYGLSFSAFVFNIGITLLYPSFCNRFLDYLGINVAIETVGVFLLIKKRMNNKRLSQKQEKGIRILSKCTFGVYLCHPLFLEQIDRLFRFNVISIHPLFGELIFIPLITVLSFVLSWLLNKIPKINKWIV